MQPSFTKNGPNRSPPQYGKGGSSHNLSIGRDVIFCSWKFPLSCLHVTHFWNVGSRYNITICDPENRRSYVVHCNAFLECATFSWHHLMIIAAISLFLVISTGCFIFSLMTNFWIWPPVLSKPFSSKIPSSMEKYLLWDDFTITDSEIWPDSKSGKLWLPDTI